MTPLRTLVRRGLDCAWLMTGGWALSSSAYLLTILASAAMSDDHLPAAPPGRLPLLVVLIPAHDEEAVVAAAVTALVGADYPSERRSVIVVADNCTDATARVAREAGALVWERTDVLHPGKGAALSWAITRALDEMPELDAALIVDADCAGSPNILAAVAARIARGAAAVQVDYVAANPEDSPAAALRHAAFLLMNTVRPRGKDALGLSCGLLGTGMAFSRHTLEEVPWEAFSVTEDREYHLRLVTHGLGVRFAPEAHVATPVPVTSSQGSAQQLRWDTGNALMARQWAPRLLRRGVSRRDVHELHAAVELLVPPQTTVSFLTLLGGAVAALRRSRRLGALTLVAGAGQLIYVFGGISLARSPAVLLRVLPGVPGLIAARVAQQMRIAAGRGAKTFVRTERTSR